MVIFGFCLYAIKLIWKFGNDLNTRLISGNSNFQLSTATHEIGHALGLDDICSGMSIMNGNRDRSNIKTTQPDDVDAAEANYHKHWLYARKL